MKTLRIFTALISGYCSCAHQCFNSIRLYLPCLPVFMGTVKVDGANVHRAPSSQPVSTAFSMLQSTVSMYDGDTVYSFDVPGDDPEYTGLSKAALQEIQCLLYRKLFANQTAPG